MALSLGRRLKATRELLMMTQEQVIERLEADFGIALSQQAVSHIENGKRKVDAERELPAFAEIYGKSIDYFYETTAFSPTTSIITTIDKHSSLTQIDLASLTHRDKLELAANLIHSVLQET